MTLLEILDTSIKIGLGALVTGVIAYFNQKASISASVTKENLLYNRNLLTNISKDVEEINEKTRQKAFGIADFGEKVSVVKDKGIDLVDKTKISKASKLISGILFFIIGILMIVKY